MSKKKSRSDNGSSPDDQPRFEFDLDLIDRKDWIGMTEGHRLPGSPQKMTLYLWAKRGSRIRGTKRRLRLPVFRFGGRNYTTKAAFDWWIKKLQGVFA